MVKTGLSMVLVVTFALRASAVDGSEQGKTPRANALPVSVLLEQAAKSPLGPGEARLLRAVADLIEKEQVGVSQRLATLSPAPATASASAPATSPAPLPLPAAMAAAAEQPARLVIRLCNAPAADVAKAVQEFLGGFQGMRRGYEQFPDPNSAIIVCEPVSNSLLISATPRMVDDLSKLISGLDTSPPAVAVDVCIAELLPRSCEGKIDQGSSDASETDKAPSMEKDGAAWLAWAKKQGRLEILGRPQVMTLNNQPAYIQIGTTVPIAAPGPGSDGLAKDNQIKQTKVFETLNNQPAFIQIGTTMSIAAPGPGSDGLAKDNQIKQPEVGLTVGLTPRISPDGLVFVELDVQRASVVKRHGAVGPTFGKLAVQTTVSAKDGQTIVFGAPIESAAEGHGPLIIALTPRVNPKR